MMQSKVKKRYKFVLRRLAAFHGFETIWLPNFDCLTRSQMKRIEGYLNRDGVIHKVKEGGQWDDEGKFFKKNLYTIDWRNWDLQYRGFLASVDYVNLEKEWKEKVVSAASSAKLAKESDFVISSKVDRSIKGLKIADIERILEKKYWQHSMILEIEKEVKNQMVVENRAKFNFKMKGGTLKRISYRSTNSYVSLKKSDGSRAAFLEKNGLHSNPDGDVKSEIPRVNCLLETGEWKLFDYDFYTHFIGEKDEASRKIMKQIFMPMYMTHFKSVEARGSRTAAAFCNERKIKSESKKNAARMEFQKISEKMEELMGKSHHSEIFIHTSAFEHIALLLCCKLYPNGKFFQIYDEIFSTVEIPNMEEIYTCAAWLYFTLYKNFTGVDLRAFFSSLLSHSEVDENDEEVEDEVVEEEDKEDEDEEEEDEVVEDVKEVETKVSSSSSLSTLVNKNAISKSFSSGVKFENAIKTLYRIIERIKESEDVTNEFSQLPVKAVDNRHGVKGRAWKESEETIAKKRQPKSEETKAKMKQPKSEETKAKMKQPKSEETKAKIKSTRNEEFQKMVEFAVQLKQSESYIALQKTREKQQFLDKAIQEEFGTLGNVTLTKIRKATK